MTIVHPADDDAHRDEELARFDRSTLIAVVVDVDGDIDIHLCVPPSEKLAMALQVALESVQHSLAEDAELQKRPS